MPLASDGDSLLLVNDEVDKTKVANENDILMNSFFVTKRGDSKFKLGSIKSSLRRPDGSGPPIPHAPEA